MLGRLLPHRLRSRLLLATTSLALAVTAVFVVLAFVVSSLRQATDDAEHSARVVQAATDTLNSVLDLETGARGFALTGRASFLEPWTDARRLLPGRLRRLNALVTDNPPQARRAAGIRRLVVSYEEDYSVPFVAAGRMSIGRARAIAVTGEGKRRVDGIRAEFRPFFAEENRLAARRSDSASSRRTLALLAIGIGLLAVLAFIVLLQLALFSWVLRPLGRISEALARLREGDLTARTGLRGADAAAQLGEDVDHTAEALEDSQKELRRSNAELEQFAYVASHDLAEPLRVMAGYSDLLTRRYSDQLDEGAQRYVAGIARGAERMRGLIDDLLAYSRVGRAELTIVPVDLGELVGEVGEDLRIALEEAGARVEADGLPTVPGDRGQLRTVLQNLVANAVKFRGEAAPVVRISARPEDGCWRIDVADNGIGIEPRHADRIFRMFQRLHSREEYAGTGIGLALCQRVVQRHGGRIWVAPGPDGGSVFTFTLPRD